MVTYSTAAGGNDEKRPLGLHQGTVQAEGPICWSVNRTMQLESPTPTSSEVAGATRDGGSGTTVVLE